MTHDDDRDLTGAEIDAVRRHRRSPADPAARRSVRASAPARANASAAASTRSAVDELRELRDELQNFVDDRERRALELFGQGRVDVDGVTHWLYLADSLTDPDAHRRQHELTTTLRGFMQELGIGGIPATVRLARRCDGVTWAQAPASRRVSLENCPAVAEVTMRTYTRGATLEVLIDATVGDIVARAALAHEAHHGWVAFACPPYRRHEFADVLAAERAADAWARDALRARGHPVPDVIAADRDLSSYRVPSS